MKYLKILFVFLALCSASYGANGGSLAHFGTGAFTDATMLSVADFGGDSTGATDSTAAFQAAITSCTTQNLRGVYFPAGTWKGNFKYPNLTVPGSGSGDPIAIEGPNGASQQTGIYPVGVATLVPNNTALPVLNVSMRGGSIRNLKFQGPGAYTANSVGLWYDGGGVSISGLTIREFEVGVMYNRGYHSQFDMCGFHGNKYGVVITNGTQASYCSGNSGDDTTFVSCEFAGAMYVSNGVRQTGTLTNIGAIIDTPAGNVSFVSCPFGVCGIGLLVQNAAVVSVIGGHTEAVSIATYMIHGGCDFNITGWSGFADGTRALYVIPDQFPADVFVGACSQFAAYLEGGPSAATLNGNQVKQVYYTHSNYIPLESGSFAPGSYPTNTVKIPDLTQLTGTAISVTGTATVGTTPRKNVIMAYQSTAQTFTAGSNTRVYYNSQDANSALGFTTGTAAGQSRFVAPITGWYSFTTTMKITTPFTGQDIFSMIWKNGSNIFRFPYIVAPANSFVSYPGGTVRVYATAGDYFESYLVYEGGGTVTPDEFNSTIYATFQIEW